MWGRVHSPFTTQCIPSCGQWFSRLKHLLYSLHQGVMRNMANQRKYIASLILLCFLLTGVSRELAHETWHFLNGTPNELHDLRDHEGHHSSTDACALTSIHHESECAFIKAISALGTLRFLRPVESLAFAPLHLSSLKYLQVVQQWQAKQSFVHYYSCGPPA